MLQKDKVKFYKLKKKKMKKLKEIRCGKVQINFFYKEKVILKILLINYIMIIKNMKIKKEL